ncbi:hypothetical protein Xkoz_00212 [Xenorhabdus kozodoii]|uniref:Uncharacterized protein n=1 Tax=Xenorhabdus kozodoii TaxID=351676 RepID=A0A2D0LHL3_9GAMM|nr:hypothetical protein Xkoz_00212 [Xenorhabdus kozodoii]
MGVVRSSCMNNHTWEHYVENGCNFTENMLSEDFRLYKDISGYQYHSVVFLTGLFYKQKYLNND